MTKMSAIATCWMFLLSSHWLTSSRDSPFVKLISSVGKRLYVNALTESERLNDTEYRSETCSEGELTVFRLERTELLNNGFSGLILRAITKTHVVISNYRNNENK